MAEALQALGELSETVAIVLIMAALFYKIMMHKENNHREERQIAQERSDAKYEMLFKGFKEQVNLAHDKFEGEMKAAREACSEDAEKQLATFEKTIDRLIVRSNGHQAQKQ